MACDGCGTGGVRLTKVSLAADFFGGSYDRLSAHSDKAPAWYCPSCSREKSLQVDLRSIGAAWRALTAGEASPLADADTRRRSVERLREMVALVADLPQRLLDVAQVDALRREIDAA